MKIRTRNTLYTLTDQGDGAFLISGHQKYCPTPTLVTLTEPPSVGKQIVFTRQADDKLVITTAVQEISE